MATKLFHVPVSERAITCATESAIATGMSLTSFVEWALWRAIAQQRQEFDAVHKRSRSKQKHSIGGNENGNKKGQLRSRTKQKAAEFAD